MKRNVDSNFWSCEGLVAKGLCVVDDVVDVDNVVVDEVVYAENVVVVDVDVVDDVLFVVLDIVVTDFVC